MRSGRKLRQEEERALAGRAPVPLNPACMGNSPIFSFAAPSSPWGPGGGGQGMREQKWILHVQWVCFFIILYKNKSAFYFLFHFFFRNLRSLSLSLTLLSLFMSLQTFHRSWLQLVNIVCFLCFFFFVFCIFFFKLRINIKVKYPFC